MRSFVLPPAKEGAYPLSVRIILTILLFVGLCMILVSPFLKSITGFEAVFLHRSYAVGVGGLVIACVSGGLRQATRAITSNNDWLRLRELLFLIGLASLVIVTDIHYSQRIGLLVFPPYYDGAEYMCAAKYAILSQATWSQHPLRIGFVIFGNRYPVWKALILINFRLFGVGEWQSYAVRFWPILIILSTIFWVVRRRAGYLVACGAALFTALLPTLSLNILSASLGHPIFPRGYLADLRPDLLFGAFIMLLVGAIIEHAGSFDEWTALLAGISAAFAILTKATAVSAVVLACGISAAFVLLVNRANFRRTMLTMLWAFLPLTILLLPWLLAGGPEITFVYVRKILTVQLSHYSNSHPTLRTEFTYYFFWLVKHMGWITVVLIAASPLLLWLSNKKKKTEKSLIHRQFAYLIIAVALYCLVSMTPAKNYFLGLPCYLTLWIFCWGSLASLVASFRSRKTEWGLFFLAIITTGLIGIGAVRGLRTWKGHEFEEGQQDRAALQQIAMDLRQLLSNDQSFISMPAYGAPDTLLFYMGDQQGGFPQGSLVFGGGDPATPEFMRKIVEPAKAVLLLSNGSKLRGLAEVGWYAPLDMPYYRAIAEWVRRPDSSYHLLKIYNLYGDASVDKTTVELYVRKD